MTEEVAAPGQEIGRYRLERLLGEGATGLVFKATRDDGKQVALKLLRPERAGDPVSLSRFVREARVASGIDPRHVTPILELGEAGGLTYLAMPYYEGGSLAGLLRERGRLGIDETVELAAQLGRGLDELHRRGVLHRDVKPSNVLLDGTGMAALSDFGLALATDSTRHTAEGQILGTPHYIAPELIEGLEATEASDIYALGCVLHESLAGEPPFSGRSAVAVGFAQLTEPPPDLRNRRSEVSADLAQALLAALEKDPGARPTSGTALARMLHVGRSAQPV
jgi:serine/threonine protein kinase